jgi:DnaK suppressor protein
VARTEKAKVAAAEVPQERFQALRQRLEAQRDEIINMYKQDLRAGQESADDGTEDIVDRANNHYNRELMFSLSDTERNTLLQIENALRRMDEGTYGRCANCGRDIALPRLEALPWARFCVDCQELAEKGMLEVEAS